MTVKTIKIVDIPTSNTLDFDTKMLVVDPTSEVTRLMEVGHIVNYVSGLAQNTSNLAITTSNNVVANLANLELIVNTLYQFANTTSNTVQLVYEFANTTSNTVSIVFDTTNTIYEFANTTSNTVQIVYELANTTANTVESVYEFANTTSNTVSIVFDTTNTIYEFVNTTSNTVQIVYELANTTSNVAFYANTTANYANNVLNNLPYGIIGFYPGSPISNTVTTLYIAAWDITFSANMQGSKATCIAAPTSNSDFSILKNDQQVGTLRYVIGSTTGIFLESAPFTLSGANGDILQVKAPDVPDTTLADIAYTLKGTR